MCLILGTVHGAVVTHLHSSFQRMEIIPAHSADDHLMAKVREGMKSALFQHQLLTHSSVKSANIEDQEKCALLKEASEEVNGSVAERAKFDAYFNIPLSNGSTAKHTPFVIARGTATATGAGCSTGEQQIGDKKKNGDGPGMPAKVVRFSFFVCLFPCVLVFVYNMFYLFLWFECVCYKRLFGPSIYYFCCFLLFDWHTTYFLLYCTSHSTARFHRKDSRSPA